MFYGEGLTAAAYDTWLHQLAVRFVAVSDRSVDYSAVQELALINRGLPYLHLVLRTQHFRVYAVAHPTPIVAGAASLTALGPDSVTMVAEHRAARSCASAGRLTGSSRGSRVRRPGRPEFTSILLRRSASPVRLVIGFCAAGPARERRAAAERRPRQVSRGLDELHSSVVADRAGARRTSRSAARPSAR